MTESIDRETVFKLLNNKDWKSLIEIFKDNQKYSFIVNEEILKPVINKYFIDELLSSTALNADPNYKYYLETFFMLHEQRNFSFKLSEDNFKKLILKIVEVENDLSNAYQYSLKFPDEESCKMVIDKYEKSRPKVISHSQHKTLHVTENKNIGKLNASISLFKSLQEYQFYLAVRNVYQMHLAIPNVALNAVLDYELLKKELTSAEKSYFFKGQIDCVVIDTEDAYKPIKFFELDSSYHDLAEQTNKDKLKDSIFSKAGQKLVRIRRKTRNQNEKDFVKLIREIA